MTFITLIYQAVQSGISRAALLSAFLLLTMAGHAQSAYFVYEDGEQTIIKGLTEAGQAADELTIPSTVTTVRSGAFVQASSSLGSLSVDGGNPAFATSLFGEGTNTLTYINMGNGMSVTNMIALLTSLGAFAEGTSIVADGFTGAADITDATWGAVTWDNVTSVTLPMELVGDQSFGSAEVYGHFAINKEIVSCCTHATFIDEDDGSNQLFYVADKIEEGRLHIQRVHYIAAGHGLLIHRIGSSSGSANLQRGGDLDDDSNAQAATDRALYAKNMLVGVTTATIIGKTDGDYTNYVLKDGAFHPTSGGTVKANRAYLRVPTASLSRDGSLTLDFDEGTTGIKPTFSPSMNEGEWYDLQGHKVVQPSEGLFIHNGKKYILR